MFQRQHDFLNGNRVEFFCVTFKRPMETFPKIKLKPLQGPLPLPLLLLLSNCLNWKINCDDHSSLSFTTAVQI